MRKASLHQVIWKQSDKGLIIEVPTIINSDINYQLMFGPNEDREEELRRIRRHHESQDVTEVSLEELKIRYI